MSFYGNVINPPKFFDSITVGQGNKDDKNLSTLSVAEGGMSLYLLGDEFTSITKEDSNVIRIGQVISDGLILTNKSGTRYFKLMVTDDGVLEIYEVQKTS